MKTEQLAVVQGWADTKDALRRWRGHPSQVLGPWALASLAVALGLLAATWTVAVSVTGDSWDADFAGLTRPADAGDYAFVLFRNGLVLALHAMACVAGFMAGSSLPQVAEGYSGVWRRIHELAGPLAIAFVMAATVFSLATQAWALGQGAANLALLLDIAPGLLLLGLLPHALLELFALFLPLAAWTIASRRRRWQELLAATFVTTGIAIPLLLVSGAIEVWVSPRALHALAGW